MARSINGHGMVVNRPRSGQTSVACRCALLPTRTFNTPDQAQRYYDDHVVRAERAARKKTKHG